jgi:methylase of polypeptide subunit release factors
MDKNQAQRLIKKVFKESFDRDTYENFLRNLLNQIEPRGKHYVGNLITDKFDQHITQYWRVGKYVDPDSLEMDLLVVEVKSLSKLDRARSTLRNFAVDRLEKFNKDCSLIAFYAKEDNGEDWRFSFVKREHKAEMSDKGKVKFTKELTPARRYSYLVGVHENCHTACQQLEPLLLMDYANPRIEEIEKAFSIEKVTDEFFEQYKGLYLKLSEQLKSQPFFQKKTEEENIQTVARFAKKLLGQIVFLYFLQKKGWLGVEKGLPWGKGPKRFMRDRFTRIAADGGNYYHDFLQYLFYEALAKERKDQADPDYYERFSCKIPFLNGGLFEAEYDDWHNLDIDLPNDLFHNDEKIKTGDIDSGTGILDVFDRYNFTIKEDEPLEKEVAVDPEMLGKVFENMLEVTERKSKGAFYTPREIVHYMCQESLIHYLDNSLNSYATTYQAIDSDQPILFGGLTDKKGQQKLEITNQDGIKVPKKDLETLIRKGHLFVENDEAALQALQRIESGEQKTTKLKIELPESIKSNAEKIDNYLTSIRACDPAIGSGAFPVGLLHEIVDARLALAPHSGKNLSVYELKRHTIHESLYGVDIDPSAVDIARLRLWLSLIVDEDDFSADKALPNLDYKIVCGNSLIGFPEDWKSQAADKIEELKKTFFDEKDQAEKAKTKFQIETEIQARMANSKQNFGYQVDFDFKLYFSEVWHEKGGFDVVIGNPPYGLLNKKQNQNYSIMVNAEHLDHYKNSPDYAAAQGGVINVYRLFVVKSGQMLNREGCFSMIFPLAYTGDVTSKKLRIETLQNKQILGIEAFPERDDENRRVFRHAKMSVCILFFRKKYDGSYDEFYIRSHADKYVDINNSKTFLSISDIKALDPINLTIPVLSASDLQVLKKIYLSTARISDFSNCFTGEIDLSLDKKYLEQSDDYSVLLKGAIIDRYMIRIKMSQGEIAYLDSKKYLVSIRKPQYETHGISSCCW